MAHRFKKYYEGKSHSLVGSRLPVVSHFNLEDNPAEVLSWISTTPYQKHYKTAKDGLLEDSGAWLFNNSIFGTWLDFNSSGLFWLHGKRKCAPPYTTSYSTKHEGPKPA